MKGRSCSLGYRIERYRKLGFSAVVGLCKLIHLLRLQTNIAFYFGCHVSELLYIVDMCIQLSPSKSKLIKFLSSPIFERSTHVLSASPGRRVFCSENTAK